MRPLDDAPGEGGGEDATEIMCLFIGGIAAGLVTPILSNAVQLELKRPTHLKPLESAAQAEPEVAKETALYNIAKIVLPWNDEYVEFGLGIVDGESPGWAIRELAKAYQQQNIENLTEN